MEGLQILWGLRTKSLHRPVVGVGLYHAVERLQGDPDFLTIYTSRFILSYQTLKKEFPPEPFTAEELLRVSTLAQSKRSSIVVVAKSSLV
jgi:hypothetical protein